MNSNNNNHKKKKKTQAGKSQVLGQLHLHNETLPQKKSRGGGGRESQPNMRLKYNLKMM
jgi:hypothetical protein